MLKVLSPGLWTSIQDLGRFGFRHYGVPVSGAMDITSANLANLLLNNEINAAVMEITLTGPSLEFQVDSRIAITGAHLSPKLNDRSIHLNAAVNIKAGDIISFGSLRYGARCYIAVANGFQADIEMESRSYYSAITSEFKVEKGDLIYIKELEPDNHVTTASVRVDEKHFSSQILSVKQGPEFDRLSDENKSVLHSQTFTVSNNNNRMAYQLEELMVNDLSPILTSAVLPGTVQLTPSGKLIILMRDAQTTGGYPRVLQLNEESINRLSQKKLGDKLQFTLDKDIQDKNLII